MTQDTTTSALLDLDDRLLLLTPEIARTRITEHARQLGLWRAILSALEAQGIQDCQPTLHVVTQEENQEEQDTVQDVDHSQFDSIPVESVPIIIPSSSLPNSPDKSTGTSGTSPPAPTPTDNLPVSTNNQDVQNKHAVTVTGSPKTGYRAHNKAQQLVNAARTPNDRLAPSATRVKQPRRANGTSRQRIVEHLKLHGACTAQQLADALGLTIHNVYQTTSDNQDVFTKVDWRRYWLRGVPVVSVK